MSPEPDFGAMEVMVDGELLTMDVGSALFQPEEDGLHGLEISGVLYHPGTEIPHHGVSLALILPDDIEPATQAYSQEGFCEFEITDACLIGAYVLSFTEEDLVWSSASIEFATTIDITFTDISRQPGEFLEGTFSGELVDEDGNFVSLEQGKFRAIVVE